MRRKRGCYPNWLTRAARTNDSASYWCRAPSAGGKMFRTRARRSIPLSRKRHRLPLRRVRLTSARLRRLQTENGFALFHQIESITRDRLQISGVGFEQIDLARLAGEQSL